jgi:hypothetical protein
VRRALPVAVSVVVFIGTFVIRVRGITQHFWLLQDQIRDWGIALRPFTQLPLVGSPTHVGGYTIGPAFYWILWLIRVLVGPWFQNLPHASGIGQAILQSGVDALLLIAIWKRSGSIWPALTTVVILATAPFDLSLAAVIWNPVMGAILSKAAIALVLLGWPRGSDVRAAIVAAIAWSAVHAYTGAVFVALAVFAAIVVQSLMKEGARASSRRLLLIACVVALLQIPYVVHQMQQRSDDGGMDAVSGSLSRVVTGEDSTRFRASATTYAASVNSIEAAQWAVAAPGWMLLACGVLLAIGYRRDPVLLAVTLLPQLLAIAGYAFWVGFLDSYYYLPILPAAVLTVVLAVTACLPARAAKIVSIAMLACVLAAAPSRVAAAHLFDMPAYRGLVKASRAIVSMGRPMRAIETSVALPPTADPAFIYRILGGTFDPRSPWVAVIQPDGGVELRRAP